MGFGGEHKFADVNKLVMLISSYLINRFVNDI